MTQNNVGIYASQISGHLWAPNGAMDALATVTVGSTSVATIEFAGIPQGYKHLHIRGIYRSTVTGGVDNVAFRFNSDSGANYATHTVYGTGTVATSAAFTSNTYGYLPSASPDTGDTAGIFGAAIIDILDYSNISKTTVVRSLNGYDDNGSNAYRRIQLSSSLWNSTAAVTNIAFSNSGSFPQYTQFALYGVK